MNKCLNLLIVSILIATAIGCAHGPANKGEGTKTSADSKNQSPGVGLQIVDGLFVRVPMIAASSICTGVYIGISPLVYLMGIGEPMARAMVETPWRFTAARPLGDFSGGTKDGKPIYVVTNW